MDNWNEMMNGLKDIWDAADASEEFSFNVVEPDTYDMIVDDASATQSSQGKPGINLKLVIMSGDKTDDKYHDRFVYHTFWFSGKNISHLKRDIPKFGIEVSSLSNIFPKAFIGKSIRAKTKVTKNPNTDKERAEVAFFLAPKKKEESNDGAPF